MHIDDLVATALPPTDGQANPSDITQPLARRTRKGGVQICVDPEVTGFDFDGLAPGRAKKLPSLPPLITIWELEITGRLLRGKSRPGASELVFRRRGVSR